MIKTKNKKYILISLFISWIIIISFACVSIYINNSEGIPIHYCSLPIAFAVSDETPDIYKKQLRDGILYWNNIIGERIFFDLGNTGFTLDSSYAAGFLMIGMVVDFDQVNFNAYTCGRTRMEFSNKTGCIMKSKIRISFSCAQDLDIFQTVVRHEAGHVLGLNDTTDFTSLMSGKIEETMTHPVDATEKEIMAIKKLYNLEKY